MFKKSMMAVLAFGLGVGLFIGCGGGSGGTVDDGGGDTTTKTYKSLLFPCDLGDGYDDDLCRYDIEENTIERFKDSEGNMLLVSGGSSIHSYIHELLEIDNMLYMSAYYSSGLFSVGVLKYDFLEGNTFDLVDLDSPKDTFISDITYSNGSLYFVAESDTNIGKELHKYDIATDQATLAADINNGSGDSDIRWITDVDGVLYFSATADGIQPELWQYDTTTDTAAQLTGSGTSTPIVIPRHIINVNDTLYFGPVNISTDSGLAKYDTKTDTYTNIASSNYMYVLEDYSAVGAMYEANDMIYFSGINYADASSFKKGYELYKYDITQDKVSLVADVNQTSGDESSSDPVELTAAHGYLYFSADDDIHGRELWKLNLTTEEVSMAKDINQGGKDSHSDPNSLVEVNDVLYFSADDGVNGRELYKCTKEDGCLITRNMNGPSSTLYSAFPKHGYGSNIIGSKY